MKVKNIAFSGFAAAILGGVCGATDANAIQLVSPEYVSKQLEAKQDVLTQGSNITITADNVISASFDTTGLATKEEVQQVEGLIPTDTVTSAQLQAVSDSIPTATSELTNDSNYVTTTDLTGYATTGDLQTVEGKIPTDVVTSAQLQAVSDSIPTATSQLTNDSNYVTTTDLTGYATTGDLQTVEGKIPTDTVTSTQLSAVEQKIPATVAELTDAADYALKTEVQDVAGDVAALQGTVGDAELATTAKTITAAINELKGKTDGMATTGNFTEMNNKISDLEQLVGTESVESQIQSATSGLASQGDLDTLSGRVDTAEGEIDSLQGAVSGLQNAGYATTKYVDDEIDAVEGKIPTTVAELTDAGNYALKSELPTATSQLTNDSKYISGTGAAGNYIVHLDGAGNVTWKAVEVIGADGNDMLAE